MKTEVVTTHSAVQELAPRWNALALLDPRDGFFRTANWYQAWMQHINPDAEPFVITVTQSTGEIVGLAPFCKFVFRDHGVQLRAVGWGGRDVASADYLDIVAEPEHRAEVVRSVIDFLWATRSQWSLLLLAELLNGSEIAIQAEAFVEGQKLPSRRQEVRFCPYIALPNSFDDYLSSLGSSTRYNIRRRMRELFEKAQAELSVYSQPDSLVANFDILVSLHLARWRQAGLPGTLGSPKLRAFLECVFQNPPPGSSCRLYALRHNSSPICAVLMFYFGESALYYQAGWDPDSALAAQSPAVAVMAQSIKDSIENGFKYYDFLRGDEAYKTHWTKTSRETYTLLGARNFWAGEYLRTCGITDLIKKRLSSMHSVRGSDSRLQLARSASSSPASGDQRKGV